MRVSQKAEHAVAALLDLALHAPPTGGVRSRDVAKRTGVPVKFLEAILVDLRKAGWVVSRRGPDGGHRLGVDPAKVTVAAILEAVDGPLQQNRPGTGAMTSAADTSLRHLWAEVGEAVKDVVGRVTLEDLRRRADTAETLDFNI
jgi:Rrf2 family iron-sulfur cluster assembly transcriptional regulator